MMINKLALAVAVVGVGVTTAAAVAITQVKKHGGHITVGIGSREIAWEFIGKKIVEVGED